MVEMWINMGPQHPMTHGLWTLKVKVDGETIIDAVPEIGYLHRGVEKLAEDRTYNQFIPIADRLCYGASMSWEHLYCMTIEDLMDVKIPDRAEYLRVIALEMQRMASHLLWLGALAPDIGNLTMFLFALREREILLDLFQNLTGARMTYNYCRIGGVVNDMPENFERDLLKALDWIDKKIIEYEGMFDESEIFLMRMQGIGTISAANAMNLGMSGPNIRASGAAVDIRKLDGYSVYNELDWEIMTEKAGDSYARYRVRVNEMRESANIIRDALKKIPAGEFRVKVPKRPEKGSSAFCRSSDPRGEAAFYIVSDGGLKPYRTRIKSPMFVNISACPHLLIGNKIADVPAIMGSIDICIGDTDR